MQLLIHLLYVVFVQPFLELWYRLQHWWLGLVLKHHRVVIKVYEGMGKTTGKLTDKEAARLTLWAVKVHLKEDPLARLYFLGLFIVITLFVRVLVFMFKG